MFAKSHAMIMAPHPGVSRPPSLHLRDQMLQEGDNGHRDFLLPQIEAQKVTQV